MIDINIPGFNHLKLDHLVLDFNGTLAFDGSVIDGVSQLLDSLSNHLHIHILTANTFGSVNETFRDSPYAIHILSSGNEDQGKVNYLRQLGVQSTACIGTGQNDRLMLNEAALGIAVIQKEGCCLEALLRADIVIPNIVDALGLFLSPQRLVATLRC